MKFLIKEQQESCKTTKICNICKQEFENKCVKYKKNVVTLELIVIIERNIEMLCILYVI